MFCLMLIGHSVGADPSLIGAQRWLDWEKGLSNNGITLKKQEKNLIDDVWTDENGRPKFRVSM